jgi:hypothetical protein
VWDRNVHRGSSVDGDGTLREAMTWIATDLVQAGENPPPEHGTRNLRPTRFVVGLAPVAYGP